jgi:trans-L-3-hydroxyproline dehydratase
VITLKTIDAHAAGEPLRLVVDGFPSPRGATMLDKRAWLRKHADRLRRALMLEPRGHADMYGAVLTEPVMPGSHAGLLFMHNEGYSTMCGHGIIAVTTIALERGLIMPGGDGTQVVFDTPAGTVRASARRTPTRVESVAYVGVPSFVLHGGLAVKTGSRTIRADVAFGGAFYAIVDGEAIGLPIDTAHLAQLRRAGMEIKEAIESDHAIVHPLEPGLRGIYGTIFTGPPTVARREQHRASPGRAADEVADLRNVAVFADAEVDRSPCGTGTSAVMAVLEVMGLLGEDKPFVHESLIGTRFSGRVVGRGLVGDYPAIVPEIEGSAWITGEHTFLLDETDPLRDGFRV